MTLLETLDMLNDLYTTLDDSFEKAMDDYYPKINMQVRALIQERDALIAENEKMREGLERMVELNCHGQSCSYFCDKNRSCDCHIAIAREALEDRK